MEPVSQSSTDAPSGTPAALLAAGIHLFGKKGFAATSTRELADRASTNIGSIAYHFGGKDGLHQACGAEIVRRIQSVIGRPDQTPPASPAAARAKLEATIAAFAMFLNGSHQADDLVSFMLQEIGTNGPAFDTIYATLIEPKHREICGLWAAASGQDADSDGVKLAVFAFLGQCLYFRIGRNVVGRRMGWQDGSPANAGKIADLLIANLAKLLDEGKTS